MLVVVAASLIVLSGLAGASTDAGAAGFLEAQPAVARALQVVETASGSASVEARGRARLTSLFPAGTVEVSSAGRAAPAQLLSGGATPQAAEPTGTSAADEVVVAALSTHRGLRLVSGDWPSAAPGGASPTPAAVQEQAARVLGLRVGDTLRIGTTSSPVTVRVVGTWSADEPAGARWFGDPLTASGRDGTAAGPFLVTPASLDHLADTLDVDHSWTIEVLPRGVDRAHLQAVQQAAARVDAALPDARITSREATTTSGRLSDTLDALSAAEAVTAALVDVALALVAALGLVATLQLAALLAASRTPESDLLRARGASTAQLVAATTVETAVLALPAAVMGVGGAAVALRLVDPASVPSAGFALLVAGVVVGGATVVSAVVALVAGRASIVGRRAGIASLTLAALAAVVLAALATWRVVLYGSPLIDGIHADPLAALSPVLLLLAGGLVAAVATRPLSALAARRSARRKGWRSASVARQLSRRHSAFVAPILALALVSAAGGFASAFAATAASVDEQAGSIVLGADARVHSGVSGSVTPGSTAVTAPPIAGLSGVGHAVTALDDTAALGGSTVSVVALPETAFPTSIAALLAGDEPVGVRLPAGTRQLSLRASTDSPTTIEGSSSGATVSLVAWLSDAQGATIAVPLRTGDGASGGAVTSGTDLTLGGSASLHAVLPAGAGAWRLVAVEPTFRVADGSKRSVLRVSGLRASSDVGDGAARGVSLAGSVEARLDSDAPPRRLAVGSRAAALGDADAPLRVVVSTGAADALGLRRGSRIDAVLASTAQSTPAVVAGVVDRIPGSGSREALAVDLVALTQQAVLDGTAVPQADDVWVTTARPDALPGLAARASDHSVEVTTRASASTAAVVDAASSALWSAAIVAACLALVILSAAAAGLARSRRDEAAVLRALGVSPTRQGALRASELGVAVTLGLLGGVVVGVVVVGSVGARFGVAASPGASALLVSPPVFDPLSWAVFGGATTAAVLVVLAVAARGTARRAATALVRGRDR